MKKALLPASIVSNFTVGLVTHSRYLTNFKYLYSSLIDFDDHRLKYKLHYSLINHKANFYRRPKLKARKSFPQYKLKGCNLRR